MIRRAIIRALRKYAPYSFTPALALESIRQCLAEQDKA